MPANVAANFPITSRLRIACKRITVLMSTVRTVDAPMQVEAATVIRFPGSVAGPLTFALWAFIFVTMVVERETARFHARATIDKARHHCHRCWICPLIARRQIRVIQYAGGGCSRKHCLAFVSLRAPELAVRLNMSADRFPTLGSLYEAELGFAVAAPPSRKHIGTTWTA